LKAADPVLDAIAVCSLGMMAAIGPQSRDLIAESLFFGRKMTELNGRT
jgi:hypothetical protein